MPYVTSIDGTQILLEQTTASDPDALPLLWNDQLYVQPVSSKLGEDGYTYYSGGGSYWLPGAARVAKQATDIGQFLKDDGGTYSVTNNVVYRAPISYAPSLSIPTNITGGLRYITTKAVEGFRLTFSLPGLYAIDQTFGYVAATVSLAIYFRKYDPLDNTKPWIVGEKNFVISDVTRSEVIKWKEFGTENKAYRLDNARYEILIVRTTPSNTGSFSIVDDVYLKEVTEINYQSLCYNHTALLGLKIRATDQLSGQLPTITSLVKGTKVSVPPNCIEIVPINVTEENQDQAATWTNTAADGVKTLVKPAIGTFYKNAPTYVRTYDTSWDGTLSETKVWTDNPVWCLYDLLTNSRYGLGDYYKIDSSKKGMMLANFYLMAKYCDEMITYVDEFGQTQQRPRFTLNIVIDQSKSAAEWIGIIAAVMRAQIYYNEGIFWIDIDRPKFTSQIFNMSNISDYSQSGTSYRSIPNTYEVQWINPDAGYEVDVFRVESEDVQLNQHIEERKKALMLIGVTNFDQAKSLAKFAMLAGKYRTKVVTFKTGTQGLRCMVGGVIGLQHDVPKWGWGGMVNDFTESAGTSILTLSSPFEYEQAYSDLKIMISQEGKLPITLNVLEPAESGEYQQIEVYTSYTGQDGVAGVYHPKVGDTYIIGLATNAVNTFKIANIRRDGNDSAEITAVEYDPQIYDLADDTSNLGAWAIKNYSLLDNPTRVSVSGIYVNKKIYEDTSGSWKVGLEVFYEIPRSSFWKGAELHYSINGNTTFTSVPGSDISGRFFIPEVSAGNYLVVVTSVYASGKQSISDALDDLDHHPWANVEVDLYTPNDAFMEGVKGLAIENMGNDGTFVGKDCIVVWNPPVALDAAASGTTTAAGTSSNNQWFRDYRVEITGVDGSIRRTTNISTPRYIYTHEMNHQDNRVTREFVVTVTAIDRIGRVSKPVSITCKNPAPPAISVD